MTKMSEQILVRFATLYDTEFVSQDHSVSAELLRRKIEWREIFVAEQNKSLVGYLRLEYLWSIQPYIALIRVVPECRRQGVGRSILGYLEGYLRSRGHEFLYSSSQADEREPQEWHRHMEFEECGFIAGINEGGVGELFFRKRL
jgi:N-acetylglutamate synthase-like GNAT family acetyltransferase